MKEFYFPVFQFSMKIRGNFSGTGHHNIIVALNSDAVKKLKYQIRQMIGYIGNFTLIELKEISLSDCSPVVINVMRCGELLKARSRLAKP